MLDAHASEHDGIVGLGRASSFGGGDGSEESTGINEMSNGKCQMANESDSWYTLSGVRLEGKPVKRGVYIRGGHKVVVQ